MDRKDGTFQPITGLQDFAQGSAEFQSSRTFLANKGAILCHCRSQQSKEGA